MGLDMYLEKAKKVEGVTPEQLGKLNNYFRYQADPEISKKYTMKQWCGCDIKDVNLDFEKDYITEFIHRYPTWDNEKQYGFNTIFQSLVDWRKANHIHRWFVENVQNGIDDCGIYEVSKEALCNLINISKQVKNASKLTGGERQSENSETTPNWVVGQYIEDPTTAKALLPTREGFFFGGTGYDQWYLEDIDATIIKIEKVVNETDFYNEIVMYTSSW